MEIREIRVLVVDDMKTMRMTVKNNLKQIGFVDIIEAANGALGYDALKSQLALEKPVHLILSDWNMPEMLGIDFLKKVRGSVEFKDLPFLMITAEGEAAQVQEALLAGVTNYLMKPFSPNKLQEKLDSIIKKHLQ